MSSEIHIFLAIASALEGNDFGYPEGERHAMLVFTSQEVGTDHDWENAEAIVKGNNWAEIEFTKAGTLSPDNVKGKDQVLVDCYEEALLGGSALLVYSDVES